MQQHNNKKVPRISLRSRYACTEALKAYANGIVPQYLESEHTPIQVNQTLIDQAKGVGEGKLVDRAAYQ